ncbi:AAA family ATPase [Geodermatophilus sabuli]|uniref:AAA family ATPase n=1 Tax=Geodermatophilus sabuli TaxID=1564158 RepID=A0A7K3VZ49_9ACTN|nr:AAA family ATPase [Geodermatophilus sabuli]
MLGREPELAVLDALLAAAATGSGATLLVRGDAGIGKSALLEEAGVRASAAGFRVLRTAGVPSEAHLPFAALHHLLAPVLARLPADAHPEVRAALGTGEPGPPMFRTALGTLDLLADLAQVAPVLLLVEDAPWLDRSTSEVLAFVGRRVAGEPIALLAGGRHDVGATPLCTAGLDQLSLAPLEDADARALLDSRAPGLAGDLRERLLGEAAGNPLALVELPLGPGLGARHAVPSAWLPLTARLEQAFASRVPGLPAATRALLLVAALDDGDRLAEVLAAGTALLGHPATLADLEPAAGAGLLRVDDDARVRFRHPLVRSAVRQGARLAARHAAHSALADVLAGAPHRQVWHRAAACVGPDEDIAAALVTAAGRAHARGDVPAAEAALERAAQLTPDPATRGERLLGAARLAADAGRSARVAELLRDAEPLDLRPADRLQLLWLREILVEASWSGADNLSAFVDLADRMQAAGDPDRALDSLLLVALRSHWSNPPQAVRDRLVGSARRATASPRDPRLLAALALADPVGCGDAVLDALAAGSRDPTGDADTLRLLGAAASAVGALDTAVRLHEQAETLLRAQGRLGLLAQELVHRAWGGALLGVATTAAPAADEGTRLAEETGQPRWAAVARLASGAVAAIRGDAALAEHLAARAERVLLPSAATPMLSLVALVRGRAALSAGRHAEAYEQLHTIADPASPTAHPFVRWWVVDDLVDAAVHSGRASEVGPLLEELGGLAATVGSPLLRASLTCARALARDDGDGFAEALAVDLSAWPFHRARLLLAHGAWLRRQRRAVDSRVPLQAARDAFEALGLPPWADRARAELRASGAAGGRRRPDAADQLTPQELQIAQLAATGLTNREIGERLYLSHRTVGAHLYRIFPKLGVSSRAALPAQLGATPSP